MISNQNGGGTATVDFKSTTSKLLADAGGGTLKNFNFIDQRGTFTIYTGSLTVSPQAASSSTADFVIGGSFSLNTGVTVTFKGGAGITIAAGGSMVIQSATVTALSDNNDNGIIENWGSFTYAGFGMGFTTEIDMAFLNHGSATLDGGGGDTIWFNRTDYSGYSFEQDQGTTLMTGKVTLKTASGYYQTGGHLQTSDSTAYTMWTTNAGAVVAELDGGDVHLAINTGYGQLVGKGGGNIQWNGATWLCLLSPSSVKCDVINCSTGKVVIKKMTLTLSMGVGNPAPGVLDWEIWGSNTNTMNANGWNAANVTLSPPPAGWTITPDWTGGDIDGHH
jgi:hypothetical protein